MLINFSYLLKESVLLWKVADRAADFHFHPSRLILNLRWYVGLLGIRESWAAATTECGAWSMEKAAICLYLFFSGLSKYHMRLDHFTSAEILALYSGEKKECFEKRERQTYETPGDGNLARYQSRPCLSEAVFKYCCALCHCFTKAIMLSSLRWHQRQRAPTDYCTTTAASM